MSKFDKLLSISLLVLMGVIAIVLGVRYGRNSVASNLRGECVIIDPLVCMDGRISNSQGVFSSGPVRYSLWFKGKTSKSNEECSAKRRVTESQYDRWMY